MRCLSSRREKRTELNGTVATISYRGKSPSGNRFPGVPDVASTQKSASTRATMPYGFRDRSRDRTRQLFRLAHTLRSRHTPRTACRFALVQEPGASGVHALFV